MYQKVETKFGKLKPNRNNVRFDEAALESVEEDSKTAETKTMTINYFGNIKDTLIGQIKTKVPFSDKKVAKVASPKVSTTDKNLSESTIAHGTNLYDPGMVIKEHSFPPGKM